MLSRGKVEPPQTQGQRVAPPSLTWLVLLSLGAKLASAWILYNRTKLFRKTKAQRLYLLVATYGVGTALVATILWSLLQPALHPWTALAAAQSAAAVADFALLRLVARYRRNAALTLAVLANLLTAACWFALVYR